DSMGRYRDLLGQLDEPFPSSFPLWKLLDMHQKGQQIRDQVKLLQGADADKNQTKEEKPKDEAKPDNKPEEPKAEKAEDKSDKAASEQKSDDAKAKKD